MTRCQRNFERPKLDCLPVIEIVYQVTYAHRHDDWLVGRNAAQRTPVEMIEMSVSHQDEVDRRQMVNFEARLLQTLDYLEPLLPVRIDQDIHFANFWELWSPGCLITRPFNEKGWNQDAGKKITFMPVGSWTQTDPGGRLGSCAIR